MAHSLTETPTRAQTVSVPDPADARTAASVETPFQALANRIAWLEAHAVGLPSGTIFDSSAVNFSSGKLDTGVSGSFVWVGRTFLQDSVAGAARLDWSGKIPRGSKLIGGVAYVRGAFSGSHAGLPGTMPVLTLVQQQPSLSSGGTQLLINTASQTDASGSAGAYDGDHTITVSGIAWTINDQHLIGVRLAGETGANSSANKFMVYGIELQFTNPP